MQNTQAINVKAGSAVATGSVTVSDSMPGVPCPDPAGYKYVGARYVPLFADPAEWSSENTYEPLTIVLYEGNSYTSKQFVPVGIQIDNEEYWAQTGNYNAQVEQYRQEVKRLESQVNYLSTNIEWCVTPEMYGAKGDGSTDDSTAINDAINSRKPVMFSNKTYLVSHPVVIPFNTSLIGVEGTVLKTDSSIPVIDIVPESDYSIGQNGFLIRTLTINGNNKATYGIHYDNKGKVENYISRWCIDDVTVINCLEGVSFTNTNQQDGYFLGVFNRVWCGSPFNLTNCGDSITITNSQFFDDGKITISNVANAREITMMNINYTAPGMVLKEITSQMQNMQIEASSTPVISITGFGNVIANSSINTTDKNPTNPLIVINNGDQTPEIGLQNSFIGCSLILNTNIKLIQANDVVNLTDCSFFESTGPVIPLSEIGQYMNGNYIDYAPVSITLNERLTLSSKYAYYKNHKVHLNIRVTCTDNENWTNSDKIATLNVNMKENILNSYYISKTPYNLLTVLTKTYANTLMILSKDNLPVTLSEISINAEIDTVI